MIKKISCIILATVMLSMLVIVNAPASNDTVAYEVSTDFNNEFPQNIEESELITVFKNESFDSIINSRLNLNITVSAVDKQSNESIELGRLNVKARFDGNIIIGENRYAIKSLDDQDISLYSIGSKMIYEGGISCIIDINGEQRRGVLGVGLLPEENKKIFTLTIGYLGDENLIDLCFGEDFDEYKALINNQIDFLARQNEKDDQSGNSTKDIMLTSASSSNDIYVRTTDDQAYAWGIFGEPTWNAAFGILNTYNVQPVRLGTNYGFEKMRVFSRSYKAQEWLNLYKKHTFGDVYVSKIQLRFYSWDLDFFIPSDHVFPAKRFTSITGGPLVTTILTAIGIIFPQASAVTAILGSTSLSVTSIGHSYSDQNGDGKRDWARVTWNNPTTGQVDYPDGLSISPSTVQTYNGKGAWMETQYWLYPGSPSNVNVWSKAMITYRRQGQAGHSLAWYYYDTVDMSLGRTRSK